MGVTMASYRQNKLNEQLTQELARIIGQVKDPRVSRSLVSITRAECAADLKTAKVYFSSVGGKDEDVEAGIKSALGFIRTSLAKSLNMRITPELRFIRDESMVRGERISALLRQAGLGDGAKDDEGSEETDGENI